jgi:Tfp pilus assembly protein PilE
MDQGNRMLTLFECFVVLAMLVLLAAIAIPNYMESRPQARANQGVLTEAQH